MIKISTGILSLLLFIVGISPVYCQSNYVSGFVVTLSNDTLQGSIDNRDWEKNPKYIRFRQNEGSEPTRYYPWQIKAFRLGNSEFYTSSIVSVDKSPLDIAQNHPINKSIIVTDTLFLRAFVIGPANLYYYQDENLKEHFYIQKGESKLEELILKRGFNENEHQLITLNKYRGQLAYYLGDCPASRKAAEKVEFSRSAIQKLVNDYNRCMLGEGKAEYSEKIEKTKLEIGAVAGWAITSLTFKGERHYLTSIDFGTARNAVAGLSLNVVLPRNRRQWSFYSEVLYHSYKVSGKRSTRIEPAFFDMTYLRVMTAGRWHYPVGLVRPYVNLGFTNSFAIRAVTNTIDNADIRTYEQGFVAGLGTTVKNFSVEARIEKGNGVSFYSGLASPKQSFYFLAGYHF